MQKANIFSNVNSHYCNLLTTLNLFQNYVMANYYYYYFFGWGGGGGAGGQNKN